LFFIFVQTTFGLFAFKAEQAKRFKEIVLVLNIVLWFSCSPKCQFLCSLGLHLRTYFQDQLLLGFIL